MIPQPMKVKTISGLEAIIFFDKASEEYPYLGMFFSEREWFPSRWGKRGEFIVGSKSGVDLDFIIKDIQLPLVA